MDAYIYCRISSNNQKEISLDSQEEVCRNYCKSQKYKVIKIVRERGSARDIKKLTGLQGLVREFKKTNENLKCLIVYDATRFSRNTLQALLLLDEFKKTNVHVYAVNDKCGYDTFQERNMFRQRLSLAEHESDTISDRVSRYVSYAKSHGGVVGSVGFGYEKVKDGKVFRKRPNHREMADIKMIDTLLNANKGIKYIADKLEKSSKFRAKDWTPTRVLYLIRKHKLGNLAKTSDLFKILNKITKEKHIEKKVIEEGQRLVHTKHAHDTRQKENKKKRMDVDAKMDVESDVDSDDDVPKPRKKDSIDI